jgi:adenylate cyclase
VSLALRDDESGRPFEALSLLAWKCFSGARQAEAEVVDGRWLVVGETRIPVRSGERLRLLPWAGRAEAEASDTAGLEVVSGDVRVIPRITSWTAMMINWCGPGGTIPPLTLAEVLDFSEEEGRERFAGKAVLIGKMAWDEHWTSLGAMPGPEIQANALNTLVSGRFLRELHPVAFLGLVALFAATTTLLVRRFEGWRSLVGALILVGLAGLVARQLLLRGIWMYWFICGAGVGVSWAFMTLVERGAVEAVLGRFVPDFLKGKQARSLGGVRTMDASILFSDIRGFTTTAEQLAPDDMLRLLHLYHSAVEDLIIKYGGTIIKTPGDAVVAVFWEQQGTRTHASCALQAGREMLADVPRLAGDWEQRGVKLAVGVGINAGEVAIGFVGKHHLEPTVIGDAVNVAARLESLTKTAGCPLIFSEAVRERLEEPVEAQCLDQVTVAGRQEAITVYGLNGP